MSLHAQIHEEAAVRLRSYRRNSAIASLAISVLTIVLIGLVLGIFLLPKLEVPSPEIVIYNPSVVHEVQELEVKQPRTTQQKPSAPSASMTRVMVANTTAPTTVPVPDLDVSTPSIEFGDGLDIGTGWDSAGAGAAGGGSMFGSTTAIPGAFKGRLYDLKQSRRGKPLDYDSSVPNFADIARGAERRRFSANSFSDYFEAPTELNLTNLAIPFTPAALGPEYFGAKDTIKPSGWIAAYHGKITAPEPGMYRFRAASDDFMVALVNGRRNLVACWPDLQASLVGNFRPGELEGSRQSPLGSAELHAGEWIDMKAGKVVEVALAIGERPGGQVGFILEVEKKGETYRTAANGRKILPLFTTVPFTDAERKEIQGRFGSYEFEWENVPVFGVR